MIMGRLCVACAAASTGISCSRLLKCWLSWLPIEHQREHGLSLKDRTTDLTVDVMTGEDSCERLKRGYRPYNNTGVTRPNAPGRSRKAAEGPCGVGVA